MAQCSAFPARHHRESPAIESGFFVSVEQPRRVSRETAWQAQTVVTRATFQSLAIVRGFFVSGVPMTITVDEKLLELSRCLADTAAQLQGGSLDDLAMKFAKAAENLLAQAVKSSETVKFV